MSYIDKHLTEGEIVVFKTKLNWTEYVRGFVVVFIGMLFIGSSNSIAGGIILVGLILTILTYLRISSSEFAVTDKRVLIKVGIITTASVETMLNKIEAIYVEQGLIGKMINSGSIIIKGTGGSDTPFTNIDKPHEFRKAVNEQISILK